MPTNREAHQPRIDRTPTEPRCRDCLCRYLERSRIIDVTSDFVYCRLHGSQELYASGYDSYALDPWADWILAWVRGGQPSRDAILKPTKRTKKGRDAFVYFDNDAKVRAPFDVVELTKRVARQRKVLAMAAAHAKK